MKNSLLVFLLLFAAFRGFGQCTLKVALTSSGTSICSGGSVVLTANASSGTAPYTYVWSTGEVTSSISVNKAGTYTVTVTDKTPGCQPVKENVTIGVGTPPAAPTAANTIACLNSSATLTATAPGGTYQWYDSATGGNFLGTGATFVTPVITADPTVFYVQTTLNGCTGPRAAVAVNLQPNPQVSNATVCYGDPATLLASGTGTFAWYTNSTGTGTPVGAGSKFVTPPLIATTTYYVILTGPTGCSSAAIPVVAAVTPPPAAPIASGTTICAGGTVTLHATGAGTLDWFSSLTGGTSLISSPDFTTPALNATTSYYVQSTVNTCVGPRTQVLVTVNPNPAAPTFAGPVTICSGSTAVLTPTGPGGTYNWYSAPVGGSLLATGPSFTTPVLSNSTTYYVQDISGCGSALTPITVNVNATPAAPSVAGQVICPGSTATLTATAPGGTYQWFDAAVGGNLLFTGGTFITPVININTTFYVQTTIGGCISSRTPVTVDVQTQPGSPVAPGVTICPGTNATLSVTSPSGNYAWYDALTNGNLLTVGPVYNTPALITNTTYFVEAINSSGCASVRTPVTVTVSSPPAPPVVSGTTICQGTNTTLTASGTGVISWYDAASGGNLLYTGIAFNTPLLFATTTYYVEATTTCTSTRIPVTVTVSMIANPQFKYPSGTFCPTAPNPSPAIFNPLGGTFSASPAGLVFISNTTGQINLSASAVGTYTITFIGNGPCPVFKSEVVTITSAPNAQFSYAGPFCPSQTIALPVFPSGSSAGVFSATPAGFVFNNTSTGQFSPSLTPAGTYTVTNTIAASGSCPSATFSTVVVVNPAIVLSAGANQTVAAGTPVTLAGSISGAVSAGTWSGGTGSFSNPNSLNAIYTPGPGETSATLTLTSANPPAPCGPVSGKVTITFSALPAAPTAAGTQVCAGSVATLTATSPGGVYQWFDAATNGNLLATGPTFVTPAIFANITYYVQTTIGGFTSSRTPVSVVLNAAPAVPTALPVSTCSGNTATLIATGSPGGYEWYDAQTGGNLLSTNNSYTTTFLTTNATYYVQSVVNGCASARVSVNVFVNPVPAVTSLSAASTCSGVAQNYTITSNVAGATFLWSRAAVANISNPAVNGQSNSIINETLVNTGTTPVNVTYIITPSAGSCTGVAFNYVVTVNPSPTVTSPATASVCSGNPVGYNISFSNPAGVTFTWSRAAVAGISNPPISGQASNNILETLINTTNLPIKVPYVVNYQTPSCTGLIFDITVTVNPTAVVTSLNLANVCTGVPQNYLITSNVASAVFLWSRPVVAGISNPALSAQTSSLISEALINTTGSAIQVPYFITPIVGGCNGTPFKYVAIVNPTIPTPVANSNTPVCAGTSIDLQSPTIPNAVYNWSGPNGFNSTQQNPTISNVTAASAGTYSLFITINGCASPVVTTNVVIDPPPLADAGSNQTVCNNATSVQLAGSVTGGTTTGLWTSSGTGTFSPAPNALNAQYLPSAADLASGTVMLTLASTSKDNCNISTSTVTITFSAPSVTSKSSISICSGTALSYVITSDFPAATFTWSRAAVAGISNPAVSGQNASTITETLFNTTQVPVSAVYTITPLAAGCPGTPFTFTVTVNPIPVTPVITSNSPVCTNTNIQLQTPAIPGATYSWTGPNGWNSNLQNPSITNAAFVNNGQYAVTVTVNGCTSPVGTINIVVDQLPLATVGSKLIITCPSVNPVPITGTVSSVSHTGLWSTSGSGTFSPSATSLNAQYIPSAQDIKAGGVTLTLSSTTPDNCSISTDQTVIKFQLLPAVTAGANQSICSQSGAKLAGKIIIPGGGIWTSSGTGTFSPNASQLDAVYYPSAADVAAGSVVLTLTANNAGTCYIPTDKLSVEFIPPPTVSIKGPVYVLKGRTTTLTPTVSDPNVTYVWSPDIDISSTSVAEPTITGDVDKTYTLTVIDSRGCISSATVNVIVSPLITVPNTFTPNGDGVNDLWEIQGMAAYSQATVDIFDRNGQKIFHSVGYGKAWDGTVNGKQVPYGVYYYIIDPKYDGLHVLTGYVTVIR